MYGSDEIKKTLKKLFMMFFLMISFFSSTLSITEVEAKNNCDGAAFLFSGLGEVNTENVFGGTCGIDTNWKIEGNRLVIFGTGKMSDYYDKEGKSAPWYEYHDKITELEVQNGVEGIGAYAFSGLGELSKLILPNTLQAIEESAFLDCDKLTQIVIPDSVVDINEYAIGYRTAMDDVVGIGQKQYQIDLNVIIHCTRDTQGY